MNQLQMKDFFQFIETKSGKSNVSDLRFGLGVSGGKDSLKPALFCSRQITKDIILINTSVDPYIMTDAGSSNLSNLIDRGFTVSSITPDPKLLRRLCKYAFFELGNIKIPMELALFSCALSGLGELRKKWPRPA